MLINIYNEKSNNVIFNNDFELIMNINSIAVLDENKDIVKLNIKNLD